MATFRIVRTVVMEAFVEAEDRDDAWDYLDTHDVDFQVLDEYDEVGSA